MNKKMRVMGEMASFLTELKRRNVFKVGVAYGIVAWLIAQIIAVIHDPLHLPEWFDTTIIVFLIIGFPLVILFTWAFELTPEGIKSSKSVAPTESITHLTGQKINYLIIAALALALVFVVIDSYVLDDSTQVIVTETNIDVPRGQI